MRADELGLGRRPQRDPDPAAGHAARRAVRGGARASRPTCCSTSTSPATAPTAGATSASPATWRPSWVSAVHAARAGPRRRWRRADVAGRARRRRALRSFHVAPCMSGVRVGPVAAWMQRRLTAAGMRPISNVVDVSNYVMLELNQPTHAYDLDTLGGGGFRIRAAADGEQMTTLDGVAAHVHRARPVDLRRRRPPDRHRRHHGWARHRDHRRPRPSCSGDRLVPGAAGAADGCPARPAIGGVRAVRARLRPVRHRPAIARFAELLGRDVPRSAWCTPGSVDAVGSLRPEQRSVDVRIGNVNRILGTTLVADDLPALLDPIGYTVTR